MQLTGIIAGFVTAMVLALAGENAAGGELELALELTPDVTNGARVYALCATCHDQSGWGKPDGSFPNIASQHRRVIIKQLADIRARDRENPTMYPFTDPETIGGAQAIADVAAYIAKLPPPPENGHGDGQMLARGKTLFAQHCAACHGEHGEGNPVLYAPRLANQHYAYLLRQLNFIRDGFRKNGDPGMLSLIQKLSPADLAAIADAASRL